MPTATLELLTEPPPEKPIPVREHPPVDKWTEDKIRAGSPKQCPKCGAFVEVVIIANDRHLPGLWCHKEGCGWTGYLPANLANPYGINQILSYDSQELIRMAPMNSTVRTLLLRRIGLPAPKSCVTSEQLLKWAADAFYVMEVKRAKRQPKDPESVFNTLLRPPQTLNERQLNEANLRANGIETEVLISYNESGHCSYTCSRSGCANVLIEEADIREIVAEALENGLNLRNTARDIRIKIKELASEDTDFDADSDNYEYENHDCDETSDYDYAVSLDDVQNKLVGWLHTHMPDAARTLENR